jgi:hypothetical protein
VIARALFAVVAVLAAAAACSFERRSAAFACETEEECPAERTCRSGWCVERGGGNGSADGGDNGDDGGGGSADADLDAFVCPPSCTLCDLDGVCVIACDEASSCEEQVVCPANIPCKVECNGIFSCAAGIDCTAARSCRLECKSDGTCAGPVLCGTGTCRVECGGQDSCAGGIDCESSCLCNTFCEGSGSCTIPPTCPPPAQCTNNSDDCVSTHPNCVTC